MSSVIKSLKRSLKRYKAELDKQPDSTYYRGLVKNTQEYIDELTKIPTAKQYEKLHPTKNK